MSIWSCVGYGSTWPIEWMRSAHLSTSKNAVNVLCEQLVVLRLLRALVLLQQQPEICLHSPVAFLYKMMEQSFAEALC